MDKNTQNKQSESSEKGKFLSKPRVFFGLTFILFSVVLTFSFVSYLMNWKADQSQAGTMLDKSIKSSNLFGKLGDWLGNIFIFESIGVASFIIAFLFLVLGTLILKKKILENCWPFSVFYLLAPDFIWCYYKRPGSSERSVRLSDHGFSKCDHWKRRPLAGAGGKHCFVFYPGIQSSSKLNKV